MEKTARRGILLIWMMTIFALSFMTGKTAYAASAGESGYVPQNVQVIRHSNTAIRIQWKTDASVDGYIVYRYNSSSKIYKQVKVIKNSATKQWVDKHLKVNKTYKYKVASYQIVDGKKRVSALSDWVSAKTYRPGSKYINAMKPKLNTKKVYLGLRSSKQVKAKVVASKFGKNKKKKPLSTKVRWYSSNPSVAAVTQNGLITAGIKPGQCSVYAVAHNGSRAEVKVIVKNYAKEDDFYNYGREDDIYTLITDFKPQIQNIAEYYSINRIGEDDVIYIDLDDDANVIITPSDADIGYLKEHIEKLLVDFPYFIRIEVYCDRVEYILKEEDSKEALRGHVRFWFDNDCSEWDGQIASHWEANRYYPD